MKTFTRILLAAGLALIGKQASAQQLLDNFENTRLVDYPAPQGTITTVANPSAVAPNTSSTVGKYDRDGSQQYATVSMQLKNAAKFANVSAYVAGTKTIKMLFRNPTGAAVNIQLVLQNRAKAIATPYVYPQGNYSGVFNATATAAATWQSLTFTYAGAQSDGSVMPTDIDQIAMLIALNSNSAATFYFDDVMGPELSTTAAPVVTDQVLDNHDGTRVIKYKRNLTAGAFKIDTLNPYKVTGNTSNNVFRYSRSNQQYDGIFIAPVGAPIADVSPFLSNAKQMTLRVYSPAVGTTFQVTLQDSVNAHANGYPAGRHSEYLATTTTANAWENLVFSFSNRPDANVSNTGVNEFVILINSNTTNKLKIYLDDFTGPHLTNYLATRTSQTATAALSAPYPNPAGGLAHLPYSLQKTSVVSLAVYDAMGRRVSTVFDGVTKPAGDYSADLRTSTLAPGLYTCRLVVDGVALTRALSVE